jgi:hypothetical protein
MKLSTDSVFAKQVSVPELQKQNRKLTEHFEMHRHFHASMVFRFLKFYVCWSAALVTEAL